MKKFEKNNLIHDSSHEKQVVLLMFPNGER